MNINNFLQNRVTDGRTMALLGQLLGYTDSAPLLVGRLKTVSHLDSYRAAEAVVCMVEQLGRECSMDYSQTKVADSYPWPAEDKKEGVLEQVLRHHRSRHLL